MALLGGGELWWQGWERRDSVLRENGDCCGRGLSSPLVCPTPALDVQTSGTSLGKNLRAILTEYVKDHQSSFSFNSLHAFG